MLGKAYLVKWLLKEEHMCNKMKIQTNSAFSSNEQKDAPEKTKTNVIHRERRIDK